MGAALLTLVGDLLERGRWRRWSELDRVERVRLYTVQSLYSVLAGVNAFLLVPAAADADRGSEAVSLLVGGTAITALGLATLAATIARYPAVRLPWRRVAPMLVLSVAYVVLAETTWSGDSRGAAVAVVVATVSFSLGVLPDNRVTYALLAGGALVVAISAGKVWAAGAGLLIAGVFVFTGRASMWLYGIVRELDGARRAQAELAVVEERLRFSRDVHDVLGRRLSTIAVQAELAATLAERGDQSAGERMLEVRGVAHEALREARELARGYRTTDFRQELDGARSLLRSAGIEVRLSVESMPRAWQEAAAWVVREAVTNVLRHSSATVVEITYASARLRVENDGALPEQATTGSGLRGLAERLAPLGATLVAGPDDDRRWSVVAELPGSGPMSATTTGGSDA